jgi:redox-sensitive bicupin YhaK (pirin superfamily)
MEANASFVLPDGYAERAAYLVSGRLQINGADLEAGHMAVLKEGQPVTIQALGPARLMLLGGAPLDGARFIEWNFVSSSRDKIEAAKRAWSEQRMGQVPGETEFIPLPPPRREERAPEA